MYSLMLNKCINIILVIEVKLNRSLVSSEFGSFNSRFHKFFGLVPDPHPGSIPHRLLQTRYGRVPAEGLSKKHPWFALIGQFVSRR